MERIDEIAKALDRELANGVLGDFYAKRRQLNRGSTWQGSLFQMQHEGEADRRGYAYHKGGRSELQFNIGFEKDNWFRFGVAFSLEPGQSLPDPVSVLTPSIQRFNAVLASRYEFGNLMMWHYEPQPAGLSRSTHLVC